MAHFHQIYNGSVRMRVLSWHVRGHKHARLRLGKHSHGPVAGPWLLPWLLQQYPPLLPAGICHDRVLPLLTMTR